MMPVTNPLPASIDETLEMLSSQVTMSPDGRWRRFCFSA
jgi:hypothetical protein